MPPRQIIIDTDPGQDDAVAILLALASPDEIAVLGITAVAGNVPLPLTERNARIVCELAGRPDMPVFAGCDAPLTRKLARALQSETRGSALDADIRLRRDAKGYSVLAPRAELRGGSGARLVSLSRLEIAVEEGKAPRIAGNIATGGANMPRITGRMERSESGGSIFRLSMQRYAAGDSELAIPQVVVAQGEGGAIGFSGRVLASGPLA